MLASSEKEKILVVWDLASGRRIASRGTHREAINSFAISPDGKHIASASNDGTLNVLDARSGDLLRVLEGHASSVQACAFSPDGSLLVSAGWDKTLRVWEVVDGTLKFIITGHTDHVQACSFSPDGKFIVSAGTDMTVRVWRAPSGERELIFPFTNPVEAIGMHPFLPRIVCGDIAGRLIILTMQGIAYDRVVVTAVAGTPGLEITCPACRQRMLVEADKLGSVVTCQSAGCSLQLEINQQVIRPDQAIYFQSYGLREVTPGSRVRNITGPPR